MARVVFKWNPPPDAINLLGRAPATTVPLPPYAWGGNDEPVTVFRGVLEVRFVRVSHCRGFAMVVRRKSAVVYDQFSNRVYRDESMDRVDTAVLDTLWFGDIDVGRLLLAPVMYVEEFVLGRSEVIMPFADLLLDMAERSNMLEFEVEGKRVRLLTPIDAPLLPREMVVVDEREYLEELEEAEAAVKNFVDFETLPIETKLRAFEVWLRRIVERIDRGSEPDAA